jgi:hypothetical protein
MFEPTAHRRQVGPGGRIDQRLHRTAIGVSTDDDVSKSKDRDDVFDGRFPADVRTVRGTMFRAFRSMKVTRRPGSGDSD